MAQYLFSPSRCGTDDSLFPTRPLKPQNFPPKTWRQFPGIARESSTTQSVGEVAAQRPEGVSDGAEGAIWSGGVRSGPAGTN